MGAPWRFRTKLVQGPPGPPGFTPLKGTTAFAGVTVGGSGPSSVDVTVSVPGAQLGQPAVASFSPAIPAGAGWYARVSATDTVTVSLSWLSADLSYTYPPGTITALVFQV